jgi:hypothetical protein
MLRQITALLAALLVGLAVLVWVESHSPSFQNCIGQASSYAPSNQSDQRGTLTIFLSSYARCTGKFADLHNALITAFATVLLAIITLGLILSGIEQQNTTRAQLRAYVMIESAHISGISNGEKPDVHITLKNSGQTTASHVTHWAKLGFSTWPEITGPIPERNSSEALPESSMAPGGMVSLTTGIEKQLNEDTINALISQSYALYVKGAIRYVDVFGRKRETDFLLFCTGHLVASGSVASYKTGNRIT